MVLISQVQALRDTIQSTLYNSTAQEHSRYVSFKSYAITYNDLAERARQVLKISTVGPVKIYAQIYLQARLSEVSRQ